ncbi:MULTISPECIES: hypothetical protein [Pseudomonas]|uniref:hypothetical protein n=1 Tax=Pseudomonas TaxID=286 RepID=UPI000F039166|nr:MULTISPECIES: hypothetical protein [Pseudomonas]MBD8615402.1 hypothetical protein [Pseudomonas putida]MBD8681945.1 hypothetical protein [Pseudomonas sp. CFBP 13719]
MSMFEHDHHIQMHALLMWANFVETGDVTLSAVDMNNCGRSKEIKRIDGKQVLFIERLRNLASAQAKNSLNQIAAEPQTPTGISLNGVWTLEASGHVCRVGKVKVAQVADVQGSVLAFKGIGYMPNIPTDLGQHPTLKEAKDYADRAVRAWINALVEMPA